MLVQEPAMAANCICCCYDAAMRLLHAALTMSGACGMRTSMVHVSGASSTRRVAEQWRNRKLTEADGRDVLLGMC